MGKGVTGQVLSVLATLMLMPAIWRRTGPLSIVVAAAGYLCCSWFAPLALMLVMALEPYA